MSNQNTSSTNTSDKGTDLITKYLADMIGVVGHVYQAIDKQVKETQDEQDVNPLLVRIRSTLESQRGVLESRLEALGGQASNPIKQAGASVLGVAAGLIDKLRAEEVAKDFRDDYVALGLTHVSYLMLTTTALAFNDKETADLATRFLGETADLISEIGGLIPQLVVRDLKDEAGLNSSAAEQARTRYQDAWKS